MKPSEATVAIQAYRLSAATAFRAHQQYQQPNPHQTAPPKTQPLPYKRSLTPELEQFLKVASLKYSHFKNSTDSAVPAAKERIKKKFPPQPSGTCTIALRKNSFLYPNERRNRYLVYLAHTTHRVTAHRLGLLSSSPIHSPSCTVTSSTVSCGIPADISQTYALRYKAVGHFRSRPAFRSIFPPPCRAFVSICPRPLQGNAVRVPFRVLGFLPPLPSLEHSTRCCASLAVGDTSLRLRKAKVIKIDTPESVRLLYDGKPDEIYRRKTSRRYALWRRKQRNLQTKESHIVAMAQRAMRDSRGHDQLLAHRKTDDRSFAPFLFDHQSGAYAFSSRISDAPKLRNAMLQKYSELDIVEESASSLETARLAAEANPLFHTRVMNRFL